ncbi:Ceramide glucosyltransferase [Heracleum sosnowskyi]|uniref:ceramide glucosyltransferase n=1 Tax=Heracleum sosnowskyi TaxID=360622 RepID=A0AAD8M079_9APIA|nr:Ceramide glucosyltransferase [Heracleum sosnowskyi]
MEEVVSPFESVDSFLFSASSALTGPLGRFVHIQGCVVLFLLALGWTGAAYVRRREIKKIRTSMRSGNSLAFLYQDIDQFEHSKQAKLPRVTVVLPLKGFGEHNLHNWRSQMTSLYGGPTEFLFMVESKQDPAYHAVSRLLTEYKDNVEAKIIVAGQSTTCSQKIHNQLVGAENMHKDSKYILFLDDDVRLHPGSIGALTAEMEKNPDIFIQTGYPLDLPSGSLGSYCIYEYHMPCSIGFATGGKTFFLWGGCMMMHSDDFRKDTHGVVSGLRDGGYSDDMTLAAIAGAHKRLITSPPVAVFPHPLASDLTFSRCWNYLRKQTFVLESYITYENWIRNRVLFFVHVYISWAFVAPYILSVIHIVAALWFQSKSYLLEETNLSTGLFLVGWHALFTLWALLAVWNLTRVEVQLCNVLSPEGPQISIASYNLFLVFIALLVGNVLFPICALRSHFSQCINWSGIVYHLKNGKIHKIDRKKEKAQKFTDLSGKHLHGRRAAKNKISVLFSLSRCMIRWQKPRKSE